MGPPKSRGPPGGPGREPPLLEAERPQSANSPRFELIRVYHGGELPAAQVSRQNFLGNGGLRDPPHCRLDAETLSRPDGEMESDLDRTRTGGRIASVPGHTALSSSCRVASHAFCLLAVVPTHPAIGNSGRLLKEFKVIFRDDGVVTTAEARGRHGLPGWDSLPLRVRQRGQRFAVAAIVAAGSGPFVAELLQDFAEEAFHPIPDPWLLLFAVAGHIQSADLVFRDPGCDLTRLERRAG